MLEERKLSKHEIDGLVKPLRHVDPSMRYLVADTLGAVVGYSEYLDLARDFAKHLNESIEGRGFVVVDNSPPVAVG